jgi:hypothetical protein
MRLVPDEQCLKSRAVPFPRGVQQLIVTWRSSRISDWNIRTHR